ncbi:MAG: PilT/PilU family type 4a pilus ATPase [Planctomycetota bacterium]
MTAEPSKMTSETELLLSKMPELDASDLHLKANSPPIYRVHGLPRRAEARVLSMEEVAQLAAEIMTDRQKQILAEIGTVDFAYSISGVGRFRLSVFRQRGSVSLAARRVRVGIPSLEDLNLPKAITRVAGYPDGLVLVVGATGSGKSTTIAAVLGRINASRRCHILTIEDPIEYMYHDDKAFINQREVGIDVPSFHEALKFGVRQDPDVILVGEMRDSDTIETALSASETGHLVFGTLHSIGASQTPGRILDFFPDYRQPQIRQLVSTTLRAIVAQKLLPCVKQGIPRIPAVEIMFSNAVIRKIIQEGDDPRINEVIRAQVKDGMQDFNMSLFHLVQGEYVTEEVAASASAYPEQLRMLLKGMVLNIDQTAYKV